MILYMGRFKISKIKIYNLIKQINEGVKMIYRKKNKKFTLFLTYNAE